MATRKFIVVFCLIFSVSILTTASVNARPSDRTLTRLEVHPQAPEFILQDLNGKQHALSDYRGKILVVNFWASWCHPCRAEMPSMQRAADWLAKHNIPLIGIGVGETRKSALRFVKETPVSFPLLLDSSSEVMESWFAKMLPTTFVLNQEGRMALLAIGRKEWDDPKILKQILSLKKAE